MTAQEPPVLPLSAPGSTGEYYAENSLSARCHDLLAARDPWIAGDIDFYACWLGEAGTHVLELGCGSGRVALALASKGFTVTGVDLASAMLELAKAKRKRLPPARAARVRFIQADMTTLDLHKSFDAAIVPYYGLNHLRGAEQRKLALGAIGRHLRSGGRAAIHVLPPEVITTPLDTEKEPGWTISLTREGHQLRFRPLSRFFDNAQRRCTQINEYVVYNPDRIVLKHSLEQFSYDWFDDGEIEQAAMQAQMKVIQSEACFKLDSPSSCVKLYVLERNGAPWP